MAKNDPGQAKDKTDDLDELSRAAAEVLKKFFPPVPNNGRKFSELLLMEACLPYGLYQIVETDEDLEEEFKFSTSEEERAELATKPFSFLGLDFASLDEVQKVAELFEERFGDKIYDNKLEELISDFKNVLSEVHNDIQKDAR